MKNIFFTILLVFFSMFSYAQSSTCQNADPFCSGSGAVFPNTSSGVTAQSGPSYGCLSTRPNPAWYYMQIGISGPIELTISQTSTATGNGIDVDFIIWGPYSSLTNICTSLTGSCTSSHNCSGNIVDCSYSTAAVEIANIPNAQVGEFYMVLITNFNGSPGTINFSQTGGTGATDCSVLFPCYAFAGNDTAICVGQSITLGEVPAATGNGNISYSWTPSQGLNDTTIANPTATPTQTTTYFLTMVDDSLCTATDSIIVTIYNPIANAGVDDTLTCANPTLNLDGSASTSGLYNWTSIGGSVISGGTTTSPLVGQTGLYVLEVNEFGCLDTDTVEIFQDATLPIVDAGTDTTITCLIDTIQLNGFVSGNNLVYYWTGPTIISGDSTLTPIINGVGTYVLTAIDTVNSCQMSNTINVLDGTNLPVVTAGSNASITCLAPTLNLNGTGSETGSTITYEWTTLDGTILTGVDSIIATTSSAGTYTLTVFNSFNSCSSSSNVVISLNNAPPIASAGADTTLNCSTIGTGVPIDGTGSQAGMNITYQWTTPNGNIVVGASSNYALVNAAGTYIITVRNTANGCVSTDTVLVTLDADIPVVDAGADTSLTCLANIIQLNGFTNSNNASYNWSGPFIVSGGTTLTPTINGPGTYVLTVVDTVNNCQNSNSVVVTTNFDLPTATAGADSTLTCLVTTLNIDGTGSTTGADITYQWTTLNGNILTGSDSIIATTSSAGTYTLTVFNTLNGCSASDSVVININNTIPTANAGADATLNCTNIVTGVTVNGSGSSSGMNYLWTTLDGNIVIGYDTVISALVNAPGTYTITVTNNTNGCVNTDDVVVFIDTVRPIANAGSDMERNCYNPTVNLNGTGSSTGSNISYLWAGSPTITNATTTTPTVNGTGNYLLTVANTTNGCTSTDVAVVTSNFIQPGANAGVTDTLCSGNNLTLTGTTTSGNVYYWTTATGQIVSGDSTLTPVINAGGIYTLTTLNTANGCTSSSSVFVQEFFVSAIITADPITGQMPLTVNFMNMGIADSSFWDFANGQTFGDTNNMSIPSPVIYETQGTYVVSLTSFNGPCSVTTRITIEVIGTSVLIVPNVFTPNGDGKNDVFEFIFENLTELNCVIFNRWGKQVAEITAPDKSWDGKNGSDGTYFYILKAKGLDDVDYNLKGTITLIR
jgi:gliding motility-associated-like protein